MTDYHLYNTGIYRITNIIADKYYIGSAIDFKKRFQKHRSDLRLGRHHSKHLQRAWDKYSESAFKFEILLYCDEENLLFYEQIALDYFNKLYNIALKAGSRLGLKNSKETREKISKSNKGRVVWNKGIKTGRRPLEVRKKISEGLKGRPVSEETRRKISESEKGKIVVISEETKKKISKALKGRKYKKKRAKCDMLKE